MSNEREFNERKLKWNGKNLLRRQGMGIVEKFEIFLNIKFKTRIKIKKQNIFKIFHPFSI